MCCDQGPDRAAVGKRLADGEVEPAVGAAPVVVPSSGQAALVGADAPASGALARRPVDAVLEEQQLDASVRRGFERLAPSPRRRAAVAARPPRASARSAPRSPARPASARAPAVTASSSSRRVRVRLGGRPADQRLRHLAARARSRTPTASPRSRRTITRGAAQPPQLPSIELRRLAFRWSLDELVDVALDSAPATSRPGRAGPGTSVELRRRSPRAARRRRRKTCAALAPDDSDERARRRGRRAARAARA